MEYLDQTASIPQVSSKTAPPRELEPKPPAHHDAMVADVESAVRRLTRGGVSDLEIQVLTDGVCLRGRCATYYCKQLAQEAAMKSVGSARLLNQIEVW